MKTHAGSDSHLSGVGIPVFEPTRCPHCGYSYEDCQTHMDHKLCGAPTPPRYLAASVTLDEAISAGDAWGANCGPGALAAALNKTLADVRPHLVGFDMKRYTNPTMMFGALRELGRRWSDPEGQWPKNGLVRVQWGGPWMKIGVPIRARYRHTHWIATRLVDDEMFVFDINGACVGWMTLPEWSGQLAPWLIREAVKRGDGTWSYTHRLELA